MNMSKTPNDLTACVHELFEAQVKRTPSSTALVFGQDQLTYLELNQKANQLAHYLRGRGMGPEAVVGLCVQNSVEMMIGLLGILKSGGAYVPLDPAYPKDRKSFMLHDTQAAIVLTQNDLLNSLPSADVQIVCLDAGEHILANEPLDNPVSGVEDENLCYVIYTSGSTGNPKGVAVEHRQLSHYVDAIVKRMALPEQASYAMVSSVAADAGLTVIFAPLCYGGSVYVLSQDLTADPDAMASYFEANPVDCLKMVPSLFEMLLTARNPGRGLPRKLLMLGGENTRLDVVDRFAMLAPDCRLMNHYGPTEATVGVSTYWYDPPLPEQAASLPIGLAIDRTKLHILDENLAPMPTGNSGELYIGGAALARGYLNRPDLTDEKFIPSPFDDPDGTRLYKTGDLVRTVDDGSIEFLGRVDDQVKIRGYRIELGEIETELCNHPQVDQCVVMVREDTPGDTRLVAYLFGNKGAGVSAGELRDFLSEKLPEYMIPTAFVSLTSVPRTPNGKVNRKALPAPKQTRPELTQAYEAPRSSLEQRLAEIWSETIKVDRVGIHDKFFELGGSSILAAQFIAQLNEEMKENIYVISIFEAPSIVEYAQFLQNEYPEAIRRKYGDKLVPAAAPASANAPATEIDDAMVRRINACIPRLVLQCDREREEEKNPRAIFILSPPRSGTTLLRVMLAGNTQLFAAPELNLLNFNSLEERSIAFSGKFSLWLEGALRAVMEIYRCDGDRAKSIIAEYQSKHYSTKAFYRVLQQQIGDRILVDKTPAYALDPEALRKAESDFENAFYIHLTRHPGAMVRSFVKRHMHQVLYLKMHSFTPPQLGELVWLVSQKNTLGFLKNIPEDRKSTIAYEQLVKEPGRAMMDLCKRLNIIHNPEMERPYSNLDQKMVDGIYNDSSPMGDVEFLNQKQINPLKAEDAKGVAGDKSISNLTWETAQTLGYDKPRSKPDRRRNRGELHARNRRKRLRQR